MAGQRALQSELAAGFDPAELDRNRRLVVCLDGFSLALCHDRAATLDDVPSADGAATLRLGPAGAARFAVAPWPFAADEVVVECEARRLDDASWVPLRWALTPG